MFYCQLRFSLGAKKTCTQAKAASEGYFSDNLGKFISILVEPQKLFENNFL